MHLWISDCRKWKSCWLADISCVKVCGKDADEKLVSGLKCSTVCGIISWSFFLYVMRTCVNPKVAFLHHRLRLSSSVSHHGPEASLILTNNHLYVTQQHINDSLLLLLTLKCIFIVFLPSVPFVRLTTAGYDAAEKGFILSLCGLPEMLPLR